MPSGSLPTSVSATTAPRTLACPPGLVSTGARFAAVTVQVKVALAVSVPSETVTVTVYAPGLLDASVPAMIPVVAFTLRPAGRPVALYVSGSPSGSFATTASDTAVVAELV